MVETVSLREVARIDRKSIAPEKIATGSNYVGLENIESGGRLINVGTVANGELASSKFVFTREHVLYGKLRPYLAKIALPEFDGICSTDIVPVLPGSKLDRRFLVHFLRQPDTVQLANSMATGANLPRLSPAALGEMVVPLPPLKEQRRIAAILDRVDELRTKRRQALAGLDALTKSIFHSMFGDPIINPMGWPMVRVGEALESAKYGSSEKAALAGDTPVLRMNNLTYGGQLDLSQMKYLPGDVDEKYLVRSGDVLFNRTNSAELVGKTAVYTGPEPMAYAGYLVRLRTNASCRPNFLGTFMNLPSTKKTLRNMCKSIVGMANINAQEVQEIKMPLPPVERQKDFEARLVAISQLKDRHRMQLAELEALFASLQHRAFRGELS
ncbi:restriction endonuclease subunit S [Arthrobacter sp. YAF34]|uniref:restriction endonuclease subunit S n=1 Tax=Arthrobacter sp. YAF34 TaxID=3233083 RepID=UPI003F8F511D